MNYYNENNPKAAAWLRELISQKLIPEGFVDERSITDVQPTDLAGYTQHHFFAGIGGWAYALRLAGWPDHRPVWTGSCPCQPFSCAGKQLGDKDPRHLWPEFRRLIEAAKPPIVFGEQVASKAGREWLAGVRAEMEALEYEFGGADLCAASIKSPQRRQRLWWVADSTSSRRGNGAGPTAKERSRARCGENGELPGGLKGSGSTGGVGHALAAQLEGHAGNGHDRSQPRRDDPQSARSIAPSGGACAWAEFDLLHCTDGKARRIESGTFPLAHGVPYRVAALSGYGNAIVPQLAAEFIQAYQECRV